MKIGNEIWKLFIYFFIWGMFSYFNRSSFKFFTKNKIGMLFNFKIMN